MVLSIEGLDQSILYIPLYHHHHQSLFCKKMFSLGPFHLRERKGLEEKIVDTEKYEINTFLWSTIFSSKPFKLFFIHVFS